MIILIIIYIILYIITYYITKKIITLSFPTNERSYSDILHNIIQSTTILFCIIIHYCIYYESLPEKYKLPKPPKWL